MTKVPRNAAVIVLGLALLVRGGTLIVGYGALRADPDDYRRLAENLVAHGTLGYGDRPTVFRPPLYPLVLAGCLLLTPGSNLAIAAVHLVLGVATVWLVYGLGRRWGLGPWAIAAAALVAWDPILLAQSTLVMTETLATFLAVASVAALGWEGKGDRHLFCGAKKVPVPFSPLCPAAVAGACLGLAILCRPTFLPFACVAGVVLPVFLPTWPSRARALAALAVGLAVVLGPWVARNLDHFGRPIVTTSHGGYTLLLGNNPQFYQYLRAGEWGTVWDVRELERARQQRRSPGLVSELETDREAYQEALDSIRREPGMFAYSCVVRVGRLWAVLPHQLSPHEPLLRRLARYGVGLWYAIELPLAALGLAGWIRRRSGTEYSVLSAAYLLLLAGSFTAVHALYWTDLRMRSPLMPGVALAATAGVAWLTGVVERRKSLEMNKLHPSDPPRNLP